MSNLKYFISKDAFKSSMASVGFIATVIGIVQAIAPSLLVFFPPSSLIIICLLVVLSSYASVRPRRNLSFTFSSDKRLKINIKVGDVFEEPFAVVTANQEFECDVKKIGQSSLMGQYISIDACATSVIAENTSTLDENELVEPGTIIDIMNQKGILNNMPIRVFVVACGKPGADGTETTWPDLSKTLTGLWSELRVKNIPEVSIPVIGSGFSGSRLTHSSLLQLILYSYYSATCDRSVVRVLNIIIYDEDYDWDSWLRVKRLLLDLGLK